MTNMIVQVTGFTPPFRGAVVDTFLSSDDCKVLYERWNDAAWSERLDCGGGEHAISCEQIIQVPAQEFVKAFGKVRATRILSAARGGL